MVDLLKPVELKACIGKVYRGRRNSFVNKKGEYVYQERMLPLKKQSCPGCKHCDYLFDELYDGLSLPIIDNIEDGALYRLKVVNESMDWETGIIDDYDLQFVKIEE